MELTLQEKLRLIEFFEFLLNEEISKPLGEMSSEAVDNYIKILLHLQDKHVELSSEFIDEQVRKIFHKEESAAPETAKTTKKQYKKNKIWLVAACVAILVALFSIISFSSEKSVKDILEDFFGTYELIPYGKEVTLGKDSYGKEGENRKYKTIEDFIVTEKQSLLFPSNMMDSISGITACTINDTDEINIAFDTDLFITITINAKIPQETIDFCDNKVTLNGVDYYFCIMEDVNETQAYFIHNKNLYIVAHTDKETLMDILNTMEEIQYEN